MDYADSYLSMIDADAIRERATETVGTKRKKRGLGAVETKPFEAKDIDLSSMYRDQVKDMFGEDKDTTEPTEEEMAETSDEVTSMVRPKGTVKNGEIKLGEASSEVKGGYPVSQKEVEAIIIREANLRNIDPTVAVAIFRSEGAGAYQSQIGRTGKGSLGGKEASFGPYQLYTGGGLGNQYEKETGRQLTEDNSLEGLEKQIQFSLDSAVDSGWTPWYGRKTAGVSEKQGLGKAKKIGNWRD